MKKNLLNLAVAILAFADIGNAQNIDVKWGKESKHDNVLVRVGDVIGCDTKGYFITENKIASIFSSSKSSVKRQNLEHEVEYTIEIPNEINNKPSINEGIYNVNNKIYVFASQPDKNRDANSLYLTLIDYTGKSSEPKLIDEIFFGDRKDKGNFDIHYISESQKFLITHNEGYSKKGNEQLNYKLFDEDFKLLWDKPIELPYQDSKFKVKGYQIDEESNVYMFGEISITKKISKKVVFAYYPSLNKLEEVKVEFGKAFNTSDLNFKYNKGMLQFIGFYHDLKGGIQGVFLTQINTKTLATNTQKTIPFSEKDLLLFTSERAVKNGKGIQADYDIKQVLVGDNGDLFIVGEAFKEVAQTQHNFNQFNQGMNMPPNIRTGSMPVNPIGGISTVQTNYKYYYNDIMLVRVSKEHEINWVQKVPKKQISANDGGYFSSYVFMHDNNNLYMFFNDNPKNLSPKTKPKKRGNYTAVTSNPSSLVVALYTINKNSGHYDAQLLFKSKIDAKSVFVPKFQQKLNDKQTLIYSKWGNKYRFGTITIN